MALVALLSVGCDGSTAPTTTAIEEPAATTSPQATTTTSSTSSTSTTTTTIAEPMFEYTIEDVDADRLAHSYAPGCPVGSPDDVVLVNLVHWGFDGIVHDGSIVVARSQGEAVAAIFESLFDLRYPIESVIPIGDLPEGIEDDDPTYNNTSALHCRRATGSSRWSEHAKGLAIDMNPLLNPFITPNTLWPTGSEKYLDRDLGEPGMILGGDDVVAAFEEHGWLWGGYWESIKDYHHFSVTGR